jgi:hypothetical protein
VTKADLLVERGARRLTELADKAAARGDGVGTWLSDELRTDAAFLRKLKPSLVKARAQGNSSADQEPAAPSPPPPVTPPPAASSGPKPKQNKKPKKRGGPPPIVIVGAAFVAGIVLAKVVDWRGHAHPRD